MASGVGVDGVAVGPRGVGGVFGVVGQVVLGVAVFGVGRVGVVEQRVAVLGVGGGLVERRVAVFGVGRVDGVEWVEVGGVAVGFVG